MYSWVPVQSWDRERTDDALYKKCGLTQEEIAFIESQVAEPDEATSDDDE